MGPVADACGNGDDRDFHQASHGARKGSLHPGDHDEDAAGTDAIDFGEEPVNSGHPDVMDPLHRTPEGLQGDRGLLGHRQVAGSGAQDPHGTMIGGGGRGAEGDAAAPLVVDGSGKKDAKLLRLLMGDPRGKHMTLAFVDRGGDPGDFPAVLP